MLLTAGFNFGSKADLFSLNTAWPHFVKDLQETDTVRERIHLAIKGSFLIRTQSIMLSDDNFILSQNLDSLAELLDRWIELEERIAKFRSGDRDPNWDTGKSGNFMNQYIYTLTKDLPALSNNFSERTIRECEAIFSPVLFRKISDYYDLKIKDLIGKGINDFKGANLTDEQEVEFVHTLAKLGLELYRQRIRVKHLQRTISQ